jgi:hypothetical protein
MFCILAAHIPKNRSSYLYTFFVLVAKQEEREKKAKSFLSEIPGDDISPSFEPSAFSRTPINLDDQDSGHHYSLPSESRPS